MKTLVMMILLASAVANAKTVTTQTLMPSAGQHEISPELRYLSPTIKYDSLISSNMSGSMAAVKYYFGLNENHAIGFETGFQKSKSEYVYLSGINIVHGSSKSDGMMDSIVRYKGNYDFSLATVSWGVGYSFSPEAREFKDLNATESESNAASGQPAVLLTAGVVAPVSEYKLGVLIDYKEALEGKEKDTSVSGQVTNYIVKKGSSLQVRAFVEFENEFHPNIGIVSWRSYSSELTSENSTVSSPGSSGSDLLGVEMSARYALAQNFEIIPQLAYFEYQNIKAYMGADSASLTMASLSGRWLF